MFSARMRPVALGLLLGASPLLCSLVNTPASMPRSWRVVAGVPTAHAEPDQRRGRIYLAQLAMVLEGARRLLLWTETYIGDPEFARFGHRMAEGYVDMAGRLVPPEKKLVNAHPHLLMVVENVERALDAAARGDTSAFRQRARIVREELLTLESVLKQLKLRLPELSR